MQEEKEWEKGAEAEEGAITDRLTECEQIPILGCACSLHYLSQEIHRHTFKLFRSLQDDMRSANAVQTTLDPWLEQVYSPTFGTNSPSRNSLRARKVKLSVTVRKVREYTQHDSVLWTELLISRGELQSLLLYLKLYVSAHRTTIERPRWTSNPIK